MDQTTRFIGLDIGKAQIEVFIPGIGDTLTIANTRTGLAALRRQLRNVPHAHVIMEATGGYERLAHETLTCAEIPSSVVNPSKRPLTAALFASPPSSSMARSDRA